MFVKFGVSYLPHDWDVNDAKHFKLLFFNPEDLSISIFVSIVHCVLDVFFKLGATILPSIQQSIVLPFIYWRIFRQGQLQSTLANKMTIVLKKALTLEIYPTLID